MPEPLTLYADAEWRALRLSSALVTGGVYAVSVDGEDDFEGALAVLTPDGRRAFAACAIEGGEGELRLDTAEAAEWAALAPPETLARFPAVLSRAGCGNVAAGTAAVRSAACAWSGPDGGLVLYKGDKGDPGADGKSAYQAWLDAGNEGSEADFLDSLKGDKGDKGDTGPQGPAGPQGAAGATGATGAKGDAGPKGDRGDKGDKGDKGEKGDAGPQGEKGERGAAGPQGAAGPKGDKGNDGVVDEYALVTDPGNILTLPPAFWPLTVTGGEQAGEYGSDGVEIVLSNGVAYVTVDTVTVCTVDDMGQHDSGATCAFADTPALGDFLVLARPANRTSTLVSVPAAFAGAEIELPAAEGRMRDLLVRLVVAARASAPAVYVTGAALEAEGGEAPEIASDSSAAATTLLSFSEQPPGNLFAVLGKEMKGVS